MCDDGSEGAEQGAGVCSAAGSWDGVRNRPWHQADCYQRFARRTQPHFWELFLALTWWEVRVKALCCVLLSGAQYGTGWTIYIKHFFCSADLLCINVMQEIQTPDWKACQYSLLNSKSVSELEISVSPCQYIKNLHPIFQQSQLPKNKLLTREKWSNRWATQHFLIT